MPLEDVPDNLPLGLLTVGVLSDTMGSHLYEGASLDDFRAALRVASPS